MPRYLYPDVPKLPGVPQLNRSSAFPTRTPPVLSGALALARLALAIVQKNVWAIYKDRTAEDAAEARRDAERKAADAAAGREVLEQVEVVGVPEPVLVPDSFRTFNFKNEWSVTDAPTEDGGFASYNKVNNPFEVVLRMTKSGSRKDRTEFLEKLDAVARSLELYKVVTPERTYNSLNVVRYEIRRDEARGAYWMSEIDVYFREIRSVTSEYTNSGASTLYSRTPGAAPIVNNGTAQPQVPSDALAAQAAGVS